MEVARQCGVKLCVTAAKFEVMKLLPWPEDLPLDRVFTTGPKSTRVHCVAWNWLGETWPYFRPNYANMELYAQTFDPHETRFHMSNMPRVVCPDVPAETPVFLCNFQRITAYAGTVRMQR